MDDKKQIDFTMHTGSGEVGRARLARWKEAAKREMQRESALLRWIRATCDRQAEQILGK